MDAPRPTSKPWQTIDPRTGRQWHWSYNPNISFGAGIVVGVLIVLLGWIW